MKNIDDYTADDYVGIVFIVDDATVIIEGDGGRWYEGEVLDGPTPYGWGGKTYQGYLTVRDLENYLRQDYGHAQTLGLA